MDEMNTQTDKKPATVQHRQMTCGFCQWESEPLLHIVSGEAYHLNDSGGINLCEMPRCKYTVKRRFEN